MKKIIWLLPCLMALALSGCFFAAGAAVGAAAIAIVYDQRNVDSILQDQRIDSVIQRKIHDNLELHTNAHISVTSFGQVVLLTGEAPTLELRKKAEELAWTAPGVKRIYNAITIQGPTSTLSQSNDAWITTKIKSEMLATKGLKAASVKVVTENGTVYLMGTVTRRQEQIIIDLVRHTSGVLKVVKIFQYEEESPEQKASATQNSQVSSSSNESSPAVTHPLEENQALIN